jgi:hypothetical protein
MKHFYLPQQKDAEIAQDLTWRESDTRFLSMQGRLAEAFAIQGLPEDALLLLGETLRAAYIAGAGIGLGRG